VRGGVGPDHRHVGDAVADLETAHALAELIDFAHDAVTHHERRPQHHGLWVEVAADHHVGVLDARG
jgi:hypothetical protein